MVSKTGSLVPNYPKALTENCVAETIGKALMSELGGSRRATKTVMRWADVTEHTARAWINGRTSPSGKNLIVLASQSSAVFIAFLKLSGNSSVIAAAEISKIEAALDLALRMVRSIKELPK